MAESLVKKSTAASLFLISFLIVTDIPVNDHINALVYAHIAELADRVEIFVRFFEITFICITGNSKPYNVASPILYESLNSFRSEEIPSQSWIPKVLIPLRTTCSPLLFMIFEYLNRHLFSTFSINDYH